MNVLDSPLGARTNWKERRTAVDPTAERERERESLELATKRERRDGERKSTGRGWKCGTRRGIFPIRERRTLVRAKEQTGSQIRCWLPGNRDRLTENYTTLYPSCLTMGMAEEYVRTQYCTCDLTRMPLSGRPSLSMSVRPPNVHREGRDEDAGGREGQPAVVGSTVGDGLFFTHVYT